MTMYNIILTMTRIDKTQVQIHSDTHEMLKNFVTKAHDSGKITKDSYNEAIKYLLEKEQDK